MDHEGRQDVPRAGEEEHAGTHGATHGALTAEFYSPSGTLTPSVVGGALRALLRLGLELPRAGGGAWEYWWQGEWRGAASLNTVLEKARDSDKWGARFLVVADAGPLTAQVVVAPSQAAERRIEVMSLDVIDAPDHADAELCGRIIEWVATIADAVRPVYARMGDQSSLYDRGFFDEGDVERLVLPPAQWLNIFGQQYVERIGEQRLAAAPARRRRALAGGGLLLVVSDTVASSVDARTRRLGSALGLPDPLGASWSR